MDSQQLLEKLTPFLKKNLLILALILVGLTFFVYGLIVLFIMPESSSSQVVFEANQENIKNNNKIAFDIEGAIENPGVYNLPQDARMQDILVASGGLSVNADRDWVSKNLNMAQRLEDGGKVYIPRVGETESIKGNTGTDLARGQININTATIQDLDSLPGIGVVTAQKIIDGRPYQAVNDLVSKKIVNSKVFEKIKEKISVY